MTDSDISKVEETCIMCPRQGVKFCAKCMNAKYCSRECQELDWKNHKKVCSSFSQPRPEAVVPTRWHRRGLYFPAGYQSPRFTWVEIWKENQGTRHEWENFDVEHYFGVDNKPARFYFEDINPIQARDLLRGPRNKLHFWRLAENKIDIPNTQVKAITRSDSCVPIISAPLLVMRSTQATATTKETFHDMDMRDFRHAADAFSWAYRDGSLRWSDLRKERLLVTHCRSTDYGRNPTNLKKYSERVLDGCDSIFAAGGSGIANLLGIPLSIRHTVLPSTYISESPRDFHSSEAMLLMRDITSTTFGPQAKDNYLDQEFAGENGFGSSPERWNEQNRAGAILIARGDGIPLLNQHVEALCGYIEVVVEPKLSRAIAGLSPGDVVADRDAILKSINKKEFLEFFEALKQLRSVNDDDWRNMPSPYDIDPKSKGVVLRKRGTWNVQQDVGMRQQSDDPRPRMFMTDP